VANMRKKGSAAMNPIELMSGDHKVLLTVDEYRFPAYNDEGMCGLLIHIKELDNYYMVVDSFLTSPETGQLVKALGALRCDKNGDVDQSEVAMVLGVGEYDRLECIRTLMAMLWKQLVAVQELAAQYN
jgi:hypothetical protein